jgi:hypothetical protein
MAKKKKAEEAVNVTAKKKEEKDLATTEQGQITDVFGSGGFFGNAILPLLKFALPEITDGAIRVQDTYLDTDTGETVIKANACGADIKFTFILGEHKKGVLEIKSDGVTRKFKYEESR